MVLLSCFFLQFLVYGLTNSFRVVFPEIIEIYGHGKGTTAWIGSISTSLILMSGRYWQSSFCRSKLRRRGVKRQRVEDKVTWGNLPSQLYYYIIASLLNPFCEIAKAKSKVAMMISKQIRDQKIVSRGHELKNRMSHPCSTEMKHVVSKKKSVRFEILFLNVRGFLKIKFFHQSLQVA